MTVKLRSTTTTTATTRTGCWWKVTSSSEKKKNIVGEGATKRLVACVLDIIYGNMWREIFHHHDCGKCDICMGLKYWYTTVSLSLSLSFSRCLFIISLSILSLFILSFSLLRLASFDGFPSRARASFECYAFARGSRIHRLRETSLSFFLSLLVIYVYIM